MDEKTVRKIEKAAKRRIALILGPEYVEQRVGRFIVPVPQYRIKFEGEKFFHIWTEAT
jgi:hypothetical protein